jgi:hypothetical protein
MNALNPRHASLYDRVQVFRFDEEGTTYTFADRLASENGWSPAYARRVIGEYRRFAFLAAAAGHPVSPSDAVDQAWHLHLVYTRSYWDEFCGRTLGIKLHHEPSRGGRGRAGEVRRLVRLHAGQLPQVAQQRTPVRHLARA